MMNRLFSLLSGLIFGFGLTFSSMTNPAKVIGFLDITGNWDPSLMFVMIGAILISSPVFYKLKNLIYRNEYTLIGNIVRENSLNIAFHSYNLSKETIFPQKNLCSFFLINSWV